MAVEDRNKKLAERVTTVEKKNEALDFELGLASSKILTLEKDKDMLHDEVLYLQSQSVRNNLVFSNIPEVSAGVTEDADKTVRQFICEKLKIAKDLVDQIRFERVHRMGQKVNGKP